MRTPLLLIAYLLVPALSHAAHRPLSAAAVDTSRFLPHWLQAAGDVGVSWLQSPPNIGRRYDPGLSLGMALWTNGPSRARGGLRLEYNDLPNSAQAYFGAVDSTGAMPYSAANGFGGGRVIQTQLLASIRVWHHVWTEAGVGRGYFDSGFPTIRFIDGSTGEWTSIPGSTGWGTTVGAGLTWEFQPTARDRLYLAARWLRLQRDGTNLDFVPIRIGYRW